MRIAASKSIRPMTAEMMMEERMAFGVYSKRGVMNNNVKSTTMDITMLETAVWDPAMKFTADRENEPERRTQNDN